jgi:ATP/maltotriose-dependent transcriptional regulator MalT
MRRVLATSRDPLARARQLPAHVEVMLAAGDVEQARAGRDELRVVAERYGTEVLHAIHAQTHAAVLLAEGAAEAAVEPLREAMALWQRVGAPYLVARLHVLLGRAFVGLGDEDGARLEWSAARTVFETLGAAPDLERLDALQRQPVSGGSSRPAPRTPGDAHGLSARELEVLRLLATGKTNRVIARELFVSDKTIDRHVSNLFGKLGVSSRAAATAYAYEHGLVQPR